MFNIHTHNKLPKSIFNHYPKDEIEDEYFSIGIHPWHIENPNELFELVKLKSKSYKCLAIGECGLDKLVETPIQLQEEYFIKQLELAEEIQKPVIIHCVKAHNELLNIAKRLQPKTSLVLHGFNQKETILETLISYPFYYSFGKDLLNQNSNAEKALLKVKLSHIFFETDDAEISINEIYLKASELLNLPIEKLVTQVELNFNKVFNARL